MDATGKKDKKALPLTEKNVTAVFSRLRNLELLFDSKALNIPENHCKCAKLAAQWWLEYGQERTWRRLIWVLDKINELSVADDILHCAEPPPDPSFTAQRVVAVFRALRDWRKPVGGSDNTALIFHSRRVIIEGKFTDEQQRREEAGLYYHHYHPNASWKDLAEAFYREKEREALELVRPHLHHMKDCTLTEGNVMEALTGVKLWSRGKSYYRFHTPYSVHDDIVSQHPGEEAAKRSLVNEFLSHHPLPTWIHVVKLIRVLEGVKDSGVEKESADKLFDKYYRRQEQSLQDSTQATAPVPKFDDKPTLLKLLCFDTKTQECVNIIDEVGAKYQVFGILLLEDKTGAHVRSLVTKHSKDCESINLEIVEEWLQGRGAKPVSWRTFTRILKAAKLTVIAQYITDTLSEA